MTTRRTAAAPGRRSAPPTLSRRRARGQILAIAPSHVADGSDLGRAATHGLINFTRDDGKTWNDVVDSTAAGPWPRVVSIEPRTSPRNRISPSSTHRVTTAPHVFRTRDFGKTWTRIVDGLPADQPSGSFARVVRTDTSRTRPAVRSAPRVGMYVSFDDGDHWQSLHAQPADDVVPRHSRSRTTISSSRRTAAASGCSTTTRCCARSLGDVDGAGASVQAGRRGSRCAATSAATRRSRPRFRTALNPPLGAVIYYWLAARRRATITLDVLDARGALVRHLSSAPIAPLAAGGSGVSDFWLAQPMPLPTRRDQPHELGSALRRPPSFAEHVEINAMPGDSPSTPKARSRSRASTRCDSPSTARATNTRSPSETIRARRDARRSRRAACAADAPLRRIEISRPGGGASRSDA